jgi:hypothetical protein
VISYFRHVRYRSPVSSRYVCRNSVFFLPSAFSGGIYDDDVRAKGRPEVGCSRCYVMDAGPHSYGSNEALGYLARITSTMPLCWNRPMLIAAVAYGNIAGSKSSEKPPSQRR